MRARMLWAVALGALCACGGEGESATGGGAAAPAEPVARAEAVVRILDYDSSELRQVEHRYVDGVALRTSEGPAALLTATPADDCLRLAVLARGSSEFGAFASADAPALVLLRNEEYPQGSVQLVEPGSTMFLAETVPSLAADDDRFVARGQQAGQEPFEDQPSLEYDVDLPFASLDAFDPLAADAGPEAAWLRRLAQQADAEPEATIAASFEENEDDWNSYGSQQTWSDLLANWDDFNVVAAASGPDCATLVVEAPGFAGGSRRAIVRARGPAGQRKVFAAESSDDYGSGGHYFVGRIEHPVLGAFPILDARAEVVPDLGPVVVFADGPIGSARWEELVQKRRAVRAVASSIYETSYMLGSLEFGGPGAATQDVGVQTMSNAYLDQDSIGGLINQGAPGEPRIVVNFQLPLKPAAAAP